MFYTLHCNSDNLYFEEKYVSWDEVGLKGPEQSPSTIWSYGENAWGNLGLNNTVDQISPVQVGSLITWNKVSSGRYHSMAIKTDGTLWAWGQNDKGELGLNTNGPTNYKSSPTQVGAATNWKTIDAGDTFNLAIKTDGTLWGWGAASTGNLGLSSLTHRSSPTQIGSLTNWKQASCGVSSGLFSIAVKTDGTMWTWGENTNGELGLGDITHRSSPVQVGTLTSWKQVSGGVQWTAAIRDDGTLWTWGYNLLGTLGLNTTGESYSSPVQVGSMTNWKEVSSGGAHAIALKTDGSIWSWGYNTEGQLGLGDITHRSSPVQIGSLTDWKKIFASHGLFSAAIKNDGTLWMWGNDTFVLSGYSSPVQIGSLTNWKSIDGSMENWAIGSQYYY